MKLPVWLAAIFVTAVLSASGWAFVELRDEVKDLRKDMTDLKVQVAALSARLVGAPADTKPAVALK